MSEKKDNSGSLFKNDKKTAEYPNRPDYTGSAMIAGVEYWISAWVKESKAGKKFFSFSYKAKDNQPTSAPKAELEAPVFPTDSSDELPF